jgi:hypothetical protein
MFTEYGTLYGVFLLLILAGGFVDFLNTVIVVIFRRDILEEYSITAIKWIKIFGCLFFFGLMTLSVYWALSGSAPMSQLMFALHFAAAVIMFCDLVLSTVLKLKYGKKKDL